MVLTYCCGSRDMQWRVVRCASAVLESIAESWFSSSRGSLTLP